MNQGISILQGPHQVAQKLSNTTLPLQSASETWTPFASARVKFAAAFRLLLSPEVVTRLEDDEQPTASVVRHAD
jgi:hypothetical protein